MDSPKSLAFVNDFASRILAAQSDPTQERFVRELVADIVKDCPLHVITALATRLLDLRRSELATSSQQN